MHKLTSYLIRKYNNTVCIEDLNVKSMMKNRHLSRSIADMSFFEFKRQLLYKVALYDGKIVVIDRVFPNGKTCSECGHKAENLPLSIREWTCPECGVVHDRDVNAARNILNRGLTMPNGSTASSAGCNACGEEGSGHRLTVNFYRKMVAKPVSVKQEASYDE